MEVANTLDFYDTATIMDVKTIIVQGPYSQNFIFFVS
jgi:hypothetical protein